MNRSLNRREVLTLSAVSAGGLVPTSAAEAQPQADELQARSSALLHTPLCDLFGIRSPVLQAPMAGIVTPEMVAEVGRSGGLGIFPGVGIPPSELRTLLRRIKELSSGRPYGVNLILHPSMRNPPRPEQISSETVRAIYSVLNSFRPRVGLAAAAPDAPAVPAIVDEAFEVILDEQVPVFSVGVGKPTPEMVARCKERGIKVVCMVTTVRDALEVAALGADAIIAQGGEAGGHRSTWVKRASPEMAAIGLMALLPQVVDAVRVPVIAAGGIADGRQLTAALALGASGVLMGTRFIATAESAAPGFYKQALIDHDSDDTTVTDAFTGLYARVLRSPFTEEYRASGAPVVPIVQQAMAADIYSEAARKGVADLYPMYAGQGLGMIDDVPSAAAVLHSTVAEALHAYDDLVTRRRG